MCAEAVAVADVFGILDDQALVLGDLEAADPSHELRAAGRGTHRRWVSQHPSLVPGRRCPLAAGSGPPGRKGHDPGVHLPGKGWGPGGLTSGSIRSHPTALLPAPRGTWGEAILKGNGLLPARRTRGRTRGRRGRGRAGREGAGRAAGRGSHAGATHSLPFPGEHGPEDHLRRDGQVTAGRGARPPHPDPGGRAPDCAPGSGPGSCWGSRAARRAR